MLRRRMGGQQDDPKNDSIFLTVLLLCGTVQPAFAAGQGTELAEILPDSVVSTASGACGDQLSWEFDGGKRNSYHQRHRSDVG